MSWQQNAILAAFVSAVVAVILGPLRAKFEEAAKERYAERRRLARLLKAIRFRLQEEERRRTRITQGGGPIPRGDPPLIWDFETWAWQILQFDALDVGAGVARKMRDHLCALMGTRHIKYLETLAEAPPRPTSTAGMSERITDSGALDHPLDAPVDQLVQDQSHDPTLVAPVIAHFNKMLAVCTRAWWPLW
jgi:hypothetical protein